MAEKIAIAGLVITALGSIAVPVALALIQRDGGAAPGGQVATAGTAAPSTSAAPATSGAGTEPSASTGVAPAQLDGTRLELPEDYYADLDTGKVDNDELFRREADVGLRSLDLRAANQWDASSKARMAVLPEGAAGPEACGRATRFTRYLSDQNMRVGMRLCVRTTKGRMFLLQVESIPTYATQPPVLALELADAPYDPSAAMFDKTLDLAEGYYADLDSGKVDNDEVFKREADIGLRSLDLTAASSWEYRSKVQLALLDEGAGREACGKETQFTRSVSDRDLRVGMQICVRSTRGMMFLLRVKEIPTYSTQPSVLVVQVA